MACIVRWTTALERTFGASRFKEKGIGRVKRLASHGQHFLRNPRFVRQLIQKAGISSQDLVVDIGAGSGVITSELAKVAQKVIAVEFEPRTATKLRDNVGKLENVEVLEGDILKIALPTGNYKVFANIPFRLSSKIVRQLTENDNSPEAVFLIVQKQFANKMLPDFDGFTGALGMMVGPLYEAKILKKLLRTDFWPHPNVDTVLLALIRRKDPLVPIEKMPGYREFVEKSFADPRYFKKTPRKKTGLPDDIKPSQMKLVDWIRLNEAR